MSLSNVSLCLACRDILWIAQRLFPVTSAILHRIVPANAVIVIRARRRDGLFFGRSRRRSAILGPSRRCSALCCRRRRPLASVALARSFISALVGVLSYLSLVLRASFAGARASARSKFRTCLTVCQSLFSPCSDVDQR